MLDKKNGCLRIDNLIINPQTLTEIDVKEIKNFEIIERNFNNGFTFFSIPNIDNGKLSLSMSFHKGKLSWVSISLGINNISIPFTITLEEREEILDILKLLGGNYKYKWGEVQLVEDVKNNTVSIIIRYY